MIKKEENLEIIIRFKKSVDKEKDIYERILHIIKNSTFKCEFKGNLLQ